MIKSVDFVRFRGFERMHAEMMPHSYIVGPNSAGKSTILEALVLAEQCLRIAKRKSPSVTKSHKEADRKGFYLASESDALTDPIRFNFGNEETTVTVRWKSNASVNIVWPKEENDEEERGFFYLIDEDGYRCTDPKAVRKSFSPINIVPVVTPLERMEELKAPAYVEAQSHTRLASRHFRNHARLMSKSGQWEPFKDFCKTWLPEIELQDVEFSSTANSIAVFYTEPGSRVPKELAWAGDGIQIWVQLLWHLFRSIDATTVVLDEPEVYLHPDLQRRLVRLLDSMSAQIVLASHSADVIAEAPPDGILWVDRRLNIARRVKSQKTFASLSSSLGSSYNLALARSLRARLVVASDFEDLRIIRVLAKQIGANKLADEQAVTMVHMRDVRKWSSTSDLASTLREILPPRLPAVIFLQGAHRPENLNDLIIKDLTAEQLSVVILPRTELENYLLLPEAIARVSGASIETVSVRIDEACSTLRERTRAEFLSTWVGSAQEGQESDSLARAESSFDKLWSEVERRSEIVAGSRIIENLNLWLEQDGYRPITAYAVSKVMKPQSIPLVLLRSLFEIDNMVA